MSYVSYVFCHIYLAASSTEVPKTHTNPIKPAKTEWNPQNSPGWGF